MRYKPAGQFIDPTRRRSIGVIPRTVTVGSQRCAQPRVCQFRFHQSSATRRSFPQERIRQGRHRDLALDDLLDRQRRAPLPVLYGQKPGISPPGKELVKTGVSEVIDQGSEVVVLFSAVNVQDHAVELMPPQIQLGGMKKTGKTHPQVTLVYCRAVARHGLPDEPATARTWRTSRWSSGLPAPVFQAVE